MSATTDKYMGSGFLADTQKRKLLTLTRLNKQESFPSGCLQGGGGGEGNNKVVITVCGRTGDVSPLGTFH